MGAPRELLLGALLATLCFAFAASAQAATVQIGQTEPAGSSYTSCNDCEDIQIATDSGVPSYSVPAGDGGVITSWNLLSPTSTDGCHSCGGALLVFAPTANPNVWDFVGESTPVTPTADGQVHSYPTSIVVAPGDAIGLDYSYVPAYFSTATAADEAAPVDSCTFTAPHPCTLTADSGYLMSVAATIQTPSASFTAPSSITPGSSVSFNGSGSTSAGTITDYRWSFGDGSSADTGTSSSASHTYAQAGKYTVSLTITDSNGDSNTASQSITVSAPPPPPPPPPPAFTGSSAVSSTLTVSGGEASVSISCSSTAVGSCDDIAALFGSSGALPSAAKAAPMFGSASFSITSGASATETVALSKAVQKKLRKKHSLPARLLITATDSAGRTLTTSASVTLKLAVKHHKKHHRKHAGLLPAVPQLAP